MIRATFFHSFGGFCFGFVVSGHAEFENKGKDIVCAGVSSAVQMCCNALTEIVCADVLVSCGEEEISLKTESKDDVVQFFLKGLEFHLRLLEEKYYENVKIKIVEV